MKGFKYQAADSWHTSVKIFPGAAVSMDFATLSTDGLLILKKGFASDGPSGPTIDTPDTIKGSFVHDALCRMMAYGLLDPKWKGPADNEALDHWLRSGMDPVRAKLWRETLRQFDFYIKPESRREILIAP
jgi:hypothetical protein